jgi:hypothetical protein
MKLVDKSVAASGSPWSTPVVAPRVRPGDRPAWTHLRADACQLEDLRAISACAGVPVDVVVALVLEWQLCTDLAAPHRVVRDLVPRAHSTIAGAGLAPTDDLRVWDFLLAGNGPVTPADELPEVCLPLRVVLRLPHGAIAADSLDFGALESARVCDRAAVRSGMVMETWVLRSLIRITDR